MKKILFFGDSITDATRDRAATDGSLGALGRGYVRQIAGTLAFKYPNEYAIVNRGCSGDRVVDLYARIKAHVWNEKPDVLTILIGVNDVWHEISNQNGVEIDRFEKIFCMMIEDTKKVLPNTEIIILEPFVLSGLATETRYDRFLEVREYAKLVKKLAEKYNLKFIPLQEQFDEVSNKYGVENYLEDGVHPAAAGATLIANEWLKVFEK